jgi:hypothetical protein
MEPIITEQKKLVQKVEVTLSKGRMLKIKFKSCFYFISFLDVGLFHYFYLPNKCILP